MHFIKNIINDHILEVIHFLTSEHVANIFMNTLTKVKFTKLWLMADVQEVVFKGGYALIPPSFSYCVNFLNPSILSQVVLKGGC